MNDLLEVQEITSVCISASLFVWLKLFFTLRLFYTLSHLGKLFTTVLTKTWLCSLVDILLVQYFVSLFYSHLRNNIALNFKKKKNF